MPSKDQTRPRMRMVHVRIAEEVHKKLRIRATESDTTLQDWVTLSIQNELARQEKHQRVRRCGKR